MLEDLKQWFSKANSAYRDRSKFVDLPVLHLPLQDNTHEQVSTTAQHPMSV